MDRRSVKGVNEGVAPVTYGTGDRPPRGNYARAGADYTSVQDWHAYTEADHDTYRRLYARQLQQLPGLACDEFIAAVQQLGAPERIPRFDDISERLFHATRWQIVCVPGLIPEEAFLRCWRRASFRSPTGYASPRSSTTSSSPTSSTISSATCRCCSTTPSQTTCRPMAPAA